jgi:tRNA(fMet)-specific endonuclease VapC
VTHLDTSFLVDLLRERRRDQSGPASEFLEALPDDEVLAVSVHVVCELMAGAGHAGAPKGEGDRMSRLCDALFVQYPDERFAATYARLLTSVRRSGAGIDTMDLLIATAAVLAGAPLVTRNRRHFSKVPGLVLVDY